MSSAFTEAQREAVQELVEEQIEDIEQAIREYQMDQLAKEVAETTQKVLAKLDDRGFETERTNVDMVGIAQECVVEAMFGSETSTGRTVEIPVAGRTNQEADSYTELTLPEKSDPPAKIVEVPIEGGDVEDPETMKWEVPDPEPIDLDAAEKVLDESHRLNAKQNAEEDEKYDPNDIPVGGLPWYQ